MLRRVAVCPLIMLILAGAPGAHAQQRLETGRDYEVTANPDGSRTFKGFSGPANVYDAESGSYRPMLSKRLSGGELELRNSMAAIRVSTSGVAIYGEDGTPGVSREAWTLVRDGAELAATFLDDSSEVYPSSAVYYRRYRTAAGDYTVWYRFVQGQPLKEEVSFTATQPGEYSLRQVWAAAADEVEEMDAGGSSVKSVLAKSGRISRRGNGRTRLPRRVGLRRGGKHLVSLDIGPAGDRFKGFEAEGGAERTDFSWGQWTLKAGESFLLDPLVYSNPTTTYNGYVTTSYQTGAACPAPNDIIKGVNYPWIYAERAPSNASYGCDRGFFEWDISIIPNNATISNATFYFNIGSVINPGTVNITPMTQDCATADYTAMWNDIGDGALYASTTPISGGNGSVPLGGTAAEDIQARLSTTDRFCIGLKLADETRVVDSTSSVEFYYSRHTLEITYTAAAPTFAWVDRSSATIRGGDWQTITSSGTLGTSGSSLKMYVCKAADGTSSGCGAGGTWCSVTGAAANPSCGFTVPVTDAANPFYAYLFNDLNAAASNNPLSGTFTTDSTPPTLSVYRLGGGSSPPYYDNTSDGVTQIEVDSGVNSSCKWYNSDDAYSVSAGTACTGTNPTNLQYISSNTYNGAWAALLIPGDNLPFVAWMNTGASDLVVTKCSNPYCTSGSTTTVLDSAGLVGFGASAAVGADGLPVIAYVDKTNWAVKVVKCGSAECNSGNTVTSVDTLVTSSTTATVMPPDGLPLIAYSKNGTLATLKCGNAACNSGNTVNSHSPAAGANLRSFVAAAVAPDGYAAIAYAANALVFYLKCGDAACTDGLAVTRTMGAETTDRPVALTFSGGGLPAILYARSNNQGAWAYVCGDPDCAVYNTQTLWNNTAVFSVSAATNRSGIPVFAVKLNNQNYAQMAACDDTACSHISGGAVRLGYDYNEDTNRLRTFSMAVSTEGFPVLVGFNNTNTRPIISRCASQNCIFYSTTTCLVTDAPLETSYTRHISCVDPYGNSNTSGNNLDVSWTNDYTAPAFTIAAVSGDANAPFVDISTAVISTVTVSGETGMACRVHVSSFTYSDGVGLPCQTSGSQADCAYYSAAVSTHAAYVACADAAGNAASAQRVDWCKFPLAAPDGAGGNWTWQKPADGLIPKGGASGWTWAEPCAAGNFPRGSSGDWQWAPVGGWEWGTAPAVQFVNVSTATRISTYVTVAKPTGTVEGDLMLAQLTVYDVFAGNSSSSIDPPAGWTELHDVLFPGDGKVHLSYKFAGPSEPANYTFSYPDSGDMAAGIMSFRGVDLAAPFTDQFSFTSGTSHSTLAAYAPRPNCMLVALFSNPGDNNTWSLPAELTSRYNFNISRADQAAGTLLLPDMGYTQQFTATTNIAVSGAAEVLVLRPPAQ